MERDILLFGIVYKKSANQFIRLVDSFIKSTKECSSDFLISYSDFEEVNYTKIINDRYSQYKEKFIIQDNAKNIIRNARLESIFKKDIHCKYVMIIDGDDYIDSKKLKTTLLEMSTKKENTDFFIIEGKLWKIYKDSNLLEEYKSKNIVKGLWVQSYIFSINLLKELIFNEYFLIEKEIIYFMRYSETILAATLISMTENVEYLYSDSPYIYNHRSETSVFNSNESFNNEYTDAEWDIYYYVIEHCKKMRYKFSGKPGENGEPGIIKRVALFSLYLKDYSVNKKEINLIERLIEIELNKGYIHKGKKKIQQP